jgi:hypothetical protein
MTLPASLFFPMVGEAKMSAITVFSTNRKKKRYTQLDWSQVQGGIIYDRILYFYGGLFFSSCPSQQTYNTRKGRQEIKIIFKM